MNSDEFFQAQALRKREEDLKALEDTKKNRLGSKAAEEAANQLLQAKGFDLTPDTLNQFTIPEIKILLKWTKAKIRGTNNKQQLAHAYFDSPVPPSSEPWTVADEERLQELKSQDVPMKETAVAVAANQMARAVTNNIAQLDEEVRRTLLDSLRDSSMDEG